MSVSILVDADACPVVIKEILYRAANRTKTPLLLVANQFLQIPKSEYIRMFQVEKGFDVADHEITRRVETGDLVITADIPLAADVIAKGATALSPRGELYDEANIKARLSMRDFMEELRSAGVNTGGPAPLNNGDKQAFASALDGWLTKTTKRQNAP